MRNNRYCTFAVCNSVRYALNNGFSGFKVPLMKKAFETIIPLDDRQQSQCNPVPVTGAIYYENIVRKVWKTK